MPVGAEDPLDVIPCVADPMYDCVRVGSPAHSSEPVATPPPGPDDRNDDSQLALLCPPGYVPRRRRRPHYELHGKELG